MRLKSRVFLRFLLSGLLIGFTAQAAIGQQIREPRLKGNPNRTPGAGGACVYDGDGRTLFVPAGKYCPDKTDHLSRTKGSTASVVDRFPPAHRAELSRLLGDHDHIAQEIARLRRAVKSGNRQVILEAADKIGAEIGDHRTREERFFEKIAPVPASQ